MELGRLAGLTGEYAAGHAVPASVIRLVLHRGDMVPIEVAQVAEQLGDVGTL